MNNEITAEEVVQQFARSIQLLLEWIEQKEDVITEDISKSIDRDLSSACILVPFITLITFYQLLLT